MGTQVSYKKRVYVKMSKWVYLRLSVSKIEFLNCPTILILDIASHQAMGCGRKKFREKIISQGGPGIENAIDSNSINVELAS